MFAVWQVSKVRDALRYQKSLTPCSLLAKIKWRNEENFGTQYISNFPHSKEKIRPWFEGQPVTASQPNSNKNDRSRKKPTSFWTPHCQLCFRIMRDAKEFSDVTLACGDGQLVEAHKVILAGSGHTSFGLSWGILSFILQFKICSILKIASFGYQHTSFAHALWSCFVWPELKKGTTVMSSHFHFHKNLHTRPPAKISGWAWTFLFAGIWCCQDHFVISF